MTYFDRFTASNNTLHAHFYKENSLRFLINKNTVDVIIGKRLFDPDDIDASLTHERALEVFNLFGDADYCEDAEREGVNVEAYEVKIASSRCFDLVLGYVPYGPFFA